MTKDLTPKQKKAVAALLTNWNVRSAAKAASVSRDTVYRWPVQEDFRKAMNSTSQKVLDDVSRELVALSASVLENLNDMLIDPYEIRAVKLRAAEMPFESISPAVKGRFGSVNKGTRAKMPIKTEGLQVSYQRKFRALECHQRAQEGSGRVHYAERCSDMAETRINVLASNSNNFGWSTNAMNDQSKTG